LLPVTESASLVNSFSLHLYNIGLHINLLRDFVIVVTWLDRSSATWTAFYRCMLPWNRHFIADLVLT